jgi:outer membrane lipoprotein carrier protein
MRVFLSLVCLLGTLLSREASDEFKAVIARYRNVQAMSGSFDQTTCLDQAGYCSQLSGRFYLRKPNEFRFEVNDPEKMIITGDSAVTWFYWPDSNLARKTEAASNPFFEIILGDAEASFAAESLGADADMTRLILAPVDSLAAFQRIRLLIQPADHSIRDIRIEDGFGNDTEYEMSDVNYNPKFPADWFVFTPPKGVVVEE